MKGMSSSKKITEQKHVTVSKVSGDKVGLDTVNKNFYKQGITRTVEAGSLSDKIFLTAHGAIEGDIVRFKTGLNTGIESTILKIDSVNSFSLSSDLPNLPLITDTFDLMRALSGTVDANGNLVIASAPVKYVLDGIDTTVNHDTVNPSNNAPLPVEIMNTSGSVTITAGNINVQTSHTGASFDSMRIGDGTNLMGVNASLEALVKATGVETILSSLLTELQLKADLLETQPISAASLPLPAGASTEATLSAVDVKLGAMARLVDTQPVSATALPLPAGASTEASSLNIISAISLLAKLTDTQPISASTLPLPTGAATEVTLASIDSAIALLAKLTDTQPISATALPLPTGAATEASLASVDGKLPASLGSKTSNNSLSVVLASDSPPSTLNVLSYATIDVAATNITTTGFLHITNAPSGGVKKVQINEDVGEFFALATGNPGFETVVAYLPLGGGSVEVTIPAGVQISIISLYVNATAGHMTFNFLG